MTELAAFGSHLLFVIGLTTLLHPVGLAWLIRVHRHWAGSPGDARSHEEGGTTNYQGQGEIGSPRGGQGPGEGKA